MSRCGVVSLLLAAALVSPLPLNAQQQAAPPVVGFLTSGAKSSVSERWVAGFHRGLGEAGYVENQNVKIEYRAADDQYDRLPGLAAEFVRMQVGVIIAAGGPVSAIGARKATDTVPIVFTTISDPVKIGLVASLNRPGGNVTGIAGLTSELDEKRMELLAQVKPSARLIGVLVNPNRPGVEINSMELEAAAYKMGLQLVIQHVGAAGALEAAFAQLAEKRIDALVVTADPFFNFNRAQVIALASRYAVPAVYQWREFVEDGGLMSYGPSIADAYHQAGVYAGRILKGAKPADLPVVQPTRFELVINLKTAKALGIEISPQMLARAHAVTE
jgi:putative ABC transport system substrate-binding protein